MELEFEV